MVLYMTGRAQAWEIRLSSLSFNSGLVPSPRWITPVHPSPRTSLRAVLPDGRNPDLQAADQVATGHAEALTDAAHVLEERLPRPRHTSYQHVHGNRFDVGKHPGQLRALVGPDGSERERAVPHDDA